MIIRIDLIGEELLALDETEREIVIRFLRKVRLPAGTLPTPKPKTTREDMKRNVSVVPRGIGPREPETGLGTLTSGGTDPRAFFDRPDEYAHEMQRPPRKMGRRLPVTR